MNIRTNKKDLFQVFFVISWPKADVSASLGKQNGQNGKIGTMRPVRDYEAKVLPHASKQDPVYGI